MRDLRASFPLDQPTESDDRDFLDGNDLEDVKDDARPETTSENQMSPLKSPAFVPGLTSPLPPQISRLGSMGNISSICDTPSVDPGNHLGKVVVLRDVPFVT